MSGGRAAFRLIGGLVRAVPGGRARLLGTILLSAAASGASVALMGVSAWLLSRAAEHPPILMLSVAVVGVRFFGVSRGVFRYVERLVGHDLALRMQSALRLRVYEHLAQTTLIGRGRGDLLVRVVADVAAIQDVVVRVVVPFCAAILVAGGASALLGTFSPGSAAVLFATALLAGLLVPWLTQRLSRAADAKVAPLRGELADHVHELHRAAADLIAFGAEAPALERTLEVDARLRAGQARAAWVKGLAAGTQVLASGTAVLAALAIGGAQVANGSLAPTMLAVLVLTPLALHEVLGGLAQAAQVLTRARAALARVVNVLDEDRVGSGDRDLVPPGPDAPGLLLAGLAVGWPGETPAQVGINLVLRPGQRVAVVGPSGSGKTTLAATILGLLPPLGGKLQTAGRLGYLAQDSHVFATSIAENVRIGNKDATDEEVATALHRARLEVDPERLVGELGTGLSGGEARRLALARLFVGDYQLLILDEPTEHLDSATAAALLDDIWAELGDRPVLVASHDPAVVGRCERVLRLA